MNAATSSHLRQEAAFLFEAGRLPEAEEALAGLIEQLGAPGTVPLKSELCQVLLDRATVLRFSNRWGEALAALAATEALARQLPALLGRMKLSGLYHMRAKILATPRSSAFDPRAAADDLHRLRWLQVPGAEWVADELEADLAFRDGDWERAVLVGARVVDALTAQGWTGGEAAMRTRVGEAALELGALERAETELTAAHTHVQDWGAPDLRARVALLLGRLRSRQGDHDAAWVHVDNALVGFDSLIRNFRVLAEQQRFLIDKVAAYGRAFSIARAGGDSQTWRLRAWTVAERSKSFSLCQIVANADVALFADADPVLRARIQLLEETLDRLERLCDGVATCPEEKDTRLREVYAERQTVMAQMMRENPRWGALRRPPNLDLEAELRRLHAAGWLPLSYYWQEAPVRGLAVESATATLHLFYSPGPGVVEHEEVPWSQADRERLAVVRKCLSGSVRASAELCPADLVEKVIPAGLRARLPTAQGRIILVSPHRDLQILPLHAFGDEGARLIDTWPVQYIPTLSLLPLARGAKGASGVAAIGCIRDGFGSPPLDDVEREITDIERVWTARRQATVKGKFIAPHGTLDEVGLPISSWGQFEYLHVACHGEFPEGRPFDASLRLGREAVRVSELFAAKLNAVLVSLSACALGRHSHLGGALADDVDEWVGMYLPLFYAGASTVLMSLWNASSEAATTLMVELHRRLADEGEAPALALHKALAVVADHPTPHWANWCLVGIPNTTRRPSN